MKILLTGGTGFIGRNLAMKLSNMGFHVLCLVRNMRRAVWMGQYPGLEPVQGDILYKNSITPHIRDIDVVFHLAGVTKARNKDEHLSINAEGAGILFDSIAMEGRGIRKIVHMSSLAVAGPHTSLYPARENDEVSPVTHYGESKLLSEQLLREKCKDIPWTIIRPPVVYGPLDRDVFIYFKMAKSGIIPILGNGELELSIIHVDDVIDGMILAAFAEASDGEIYYLSDGTVHTFAEVAHMLSKITGGAKIISLPSLIVKIAGIVADGIGCVSGKPQVINRQKVKEALQKGWVCNTDKIREELGFHPTIELEMGLESTYLWYRNAGWL